MLIPDQSPIPWLRFTAPAPPQIENVSADDLGASRKERHSSVLSSLGIGKPPLAKRIRYRSRATYNIARDFKRDELIRVPEQKAFFVLEDDLQPLRITSAMGPNLQWQLCRRCSQ
jgi:hypothetical protein